MRENWLYANQKGQALTEFVVVGLFILVPLFLIIPTVAKLISLKQDVELAARYAAWERTVWYQSVGAANLSGYNGVVPVKSDAEIASEIDHRIFARDVQPIVSDGDGTGTQVAYELDPFARRLNQQQAPLLKQGNAGAPAGQAKYASVNTSQSTVPGLLAGFTADFFNAIGGVTRFKLNTKGLFDASVSVDIADLTDIFGLANANLDSLKLSAHNVLLAESWTAGGTEHAKYLVSGLLPQQYLDNDVVGDFQALASAFPIARELDPDCLDFGHTDLEPVPTHRLENITGGAQGPGATHCNL